MGIRLPGPGGARLLASRSQAQSPELTRWVLTSGAPSRSWDMRELTVHAAMNASSPPGGPQGGAPETLLRASRARPLYSGKRLVFHAGPFLSCHGLPWGRISLGSRYSCRLERQRVRGPGGSWLAWGLCVSPIAARRAGSGFPFLSCASGRARGAVCVVHGMAGGSSIWGLAGGAEGSELSIARGRGWHINLRVSCKGGASLQ